MCGRYAISKLPEELIEEFEISAGNTGAILPASWNIAPTQPIYIIRNNSENLKRELIDVSWGIIAPWSKTKAEAIRSQSIAINARIETVFEKPTFRRAFRSQRCLIPATGYYEWATELNFPTKQPFYISNKSENLSLAMAGIYETWQDESGQTISTAAIITRAAEDFLAKIHNRMPTFLPKEKWHNWLDKDLNQVEHIRSLLDIDNSTAHLQAVPVSNRVNSPRNNDSDLIRPIEIPPDQTLF
jgi:putative SOS response-associated peptidase YedK